MSKTKLSGVENNLAVMVSLTQAQADVMESLAEQFYTLATISEDFRATGDVFKQSAIETRKSIDTQMVGLRAYDKSGKVESFLKSFRLDAKWVKR